MAARLHRVKRAHSHASIFTYAVALIPSLFYMMGVFAYRSCQGDKRASELGNGGGGVQGGAISCSCPV